MKTEYALFDASKYLDSNETIAEYLTACAEDENPDVLLAALADVAKARGMRRVAEAKEADALRIGCASVAPRSGV